jgi:hypothetical protein
MNSETGFKSLSIIGFFPHYSPIFMFFFLHTFEVIFTSNPLNFVNFFLQSILIPIIKRFYSKIIVNCLNNEES